MWVRRQQCGARDPGIRQDLGGILQHWGHQAVVGVTMHHCGAPCTIVSHDTMVWVAIYWCGSPPYTGVGHHAPS